PPAPHPLSLHDALPISATFGLYAGLAAPLAIAIGLMLVAGLTLLPALLAICGPVAFWPSSVRPGAGRPGWWGPACSRIVRRPLTDRKSTRLNSSHVSIS